MDFRSPAVPAAKAPFPVQSCRAPLQRAGTRRPDPVGTGLQGRSVRQASPSKLKKPLSSDPVAAQPPAPRNTTGGLDLGDPQLAINFVPPGYRPPESLVPRPPFRPLLKNNLWISQDFQQPDSLSYIERQLALRRQAEDNNKEFHFPPLLTCLENIQIFIDHIRSGAQFRGALTAEEDQALAWMHKTAAQLARTGVPYKRSVRLAIMLMTLCEMMTARHVFDPLRNSSTGLDTGRISTRPPVAMTPEEVRILIWTRSRSRYQDHYREQVAQKLGEPVKDLLCDMLDDDAFFVYPTFQELDLPDFCQFGHLPLHPVGLITDYALNADSLMMSPLEFVVHDIGHMFSLRDIGTRTPWITTAAAMVLHSPVQRLALRQLLLDQMPAQLADFQLRPALVLLLFQLLHEQGPSEAASGLDSGHQAFDYCLQLLARARREQRSAYGKNYQNIPDTQAAMAALWTVRLWQCWQEAGSQPLTSAQVHSCLQAFEAQDVPLLQEHFDFIERHRACLRQLFLEHLCVSLPSSDAEGAFLAWFGTALGSSLNGRNLFQQKCDNEAMCHIDNTDLAWFAASSRPWIRQQVEEATGARPPQAPGCNKGLSEPAQVSPPALPAAQAADSTGQEVMP